MTDKETVWLSQLPDGDIVLALHRSSGRKVTLEVTPECGRHLAYRLLSFAAGQKTEPELVLEGEIPNGRGR